MNKEELEEVEKQESEVRNGTTDGSQTLEARTGPDTNHVKEESADSVAGIPTTYRRGEGKEDIRNGNCDKETDKLEPRQTSDSPSESQVDTKGSNRISRAMTMSFYGPSELEELHTRFAPRTAADIQHRERH